MLRVISLYFRTLLCADRHIMTGNRYCEFAITVTAILKRTKIHGKLFISEGELGQTLWNYPIAGGYLSHLY